MLAHKRKKPLRISPTGGDASVKILDDERFVCCGLPYEGGSLLGDRDGCAWSFTFDGQLAGYLHIGGAIEAMNVSPDGACLLFATGAGTLVEYDRASPTPDPYKVQSAATGSPHERREPSPEHPPA